MEQLRFTIPEIISLIGVAQCVYILVYMGFRSGSLSRAVLPILYFFVLGLAFLSDFARSYIHDIWAYYDHAQWFLWFYGPPISVLLIMQVAQITKMPAFYHYWVIFLTPVAYLVSINMAQTPEEFREWLIIAGLVAGAISLLAIWGNRGVFESIHKEKIGKERYWLIIALILMNIFFLGGMLFTLNESVTEQDVVLLRTMLGLSFVYLVSTSLFRIYPQAVHMTDRLGRKDDLSAGDEGIALKIEKLLNLDKVYQEATYSRTDLARECGVSESVLSKIINTHFKRSFPQLMNERRVKDAKQLLIETSAPVRVIANDVGFNSLASFNRVFKDMTGESPSQFRKTSVKGA